MRNHDTDAAQGRPIWIFMAATAMATTISTLAATAMVKAEATAPVAVTCACDVPTPVVVPAPAAPAPEAPRPAAESNALDEMVAPSIAPAAEAPEQAEAPEPAADPLAPTAARPAPKAEVEGALDRDIIRRIVRAHISEVRECYDAGLQHDPELAGRVAVQFVIGPKGKVTRATAESEMEGDVPACIAKAVEGWLFPRPADGKDVAVAYPFVLEPG